jgi:hypothetical protein
VMGTTGGDELTMGDGGNRVFAKAGDDSVEGGAGNDRLRGGIGDDALFGGEDDDRLRGGQDNDLLDGGQGDDYLNGGGDGRDKDRVVCGVGYDVVLLGRNDVVLVEVSASEEPVLEEPESGSEDGCEKVKGPGAPQACASHGSGCAGVERPCIATPRECVEDDQMPCASGAGDCDQPAEDLCVASYRGCDDPVNGEPEPDPRVQAPASEGVSE